jgi:hypothetical protein
MRRPALAAVVAAVGVLAMAGPSAAQTSPTLTLTESCTTSDGTRFYGIDITVSGVAPFATVSGSVTFPGGVRIGGSIFADETGVARTGFGSGPGLYVVEITSPFSTSQSLNVDCLPNTKEDCKNGGWQGFFGVFKNQGDCVSFVATGGRNVPAGTGAPNSASG